MDGVLTDPDFLAHTFVVIDFEALTPKGRPAEPIEVAAAAISFRTGESVETGRFESLIRPPGDVPVTAFDTAQTGLTTTALHRARPAAAVMAALDARLTAPPYRLVAHHAATEAGLIARQHAHCPKLAATPVLCTVRLARIAYPELSSHALNEVLRFLRIPVPPDRHRAMPDVLVTCKVFERIVADGAAAGRWSSLRDLDLAAAVHAKPQPMGSTDDAAQESLF